MSKAEKVELKYFFELFPNYAGMVNYIKLYCRFRGKIISTTTAWAVVDYLEMMIDENYSLEEWFDDTCSMYPETFEN